MNSLTYSFKKISLSAALCLTTALLLLAFDNLQASNQMQTTEDEIARLSAVTTIDTAQK